MSNDPTTAGSSPPATPPENAVTVAALDATRAERVRQGRRLAIGAFVMAAVLAVATAAAFAVDLDVTRLVTEPIPGGPDDRPIRLPGDVRRLIDLAEAFAHGGGILIILLLVIRLEVGGVRFAPRLMLGSFGAGLTADVLKLVLGRVRPRVYDAVENPMPESVWDTFLTTWPRWRPEIAERLGVAPWLSASDIQAFPSGHSAAAVGLAMVLAWRYPRAAPIWGVLAILSLVQRVVSHAHYLSDTLAGAAVGFFVAGVILHPRLLGGPLDRGEARLGRYLDARRHRRLTPKAAAS